MEFYDKRALAILGVIVLAIGSSLISSMIYYENSALKDNYAHFLSKRQTNCTLDKFNVPR